MSYENFNDKIKHLDEEKRISILDFVTRNRKIFANDKFDVGNVTNYLCDINLSTNTYISKKPYRCTFDDQFVIDHQ